MTNNTRITLAVLGQKVSDGFKNLEEKIDKIEGHVCKVNGCINSNEKAIIENRVRIETHIKESEKKSRWSIFKIGG